MEEAYWVGRMGLRTSEIPTLLTNRGEQLRGSAFRYELPVICSYARYPIKAFTERATRGINWAPRLDKGGAE